MTQMTITDLTKLAAAIGIDVDARGGKSRLADALELPHYHVHRAYREGDVNHHVADACEVLATAIQSGEYSPDRRVSFTLPTMPEVESEPEETKDEVLARIQRNFRVMARLVHKTITGAYTSLIISGPGGIGKSHPTKAALRWAHLNDDVDYVEVSGKMTAPGLFKALWAVRDGGVLLIDDCDSVFEDNNALNLLKAALDSSDRRVISWFSQGSWIEDEGMEAQFEFQGQVIFITNIDFDAEIEKGTKRSVHLEALVSRSVLMDLDIKSTRDLLVRIEDMVMNVGMVDKFGLDENQKRDLVDFMTEHASKFRSLTLREAVKMAKMIAADDSGDGSEWRDEALVTLAKGRSPRRR